MTDEQIWEAVERATGLKRPLLLTVLEYGRIVRKSKPTVYREVARGLVHAYKARRNGSIRIPTTEVFRYFRQEHQEEQGA